MAYFLYMHIAPHGKVYIGIHEGVKVEDRWGKNGEGYKKHHSHFWNAIQKYGWSNFEHYVWELQSEQEMMDCEEMAIAFFDSQNPEYGYNKTSGGEHPKPSSETKTKISVKTKQAMDAIPLEKKLSTYAKISKANSGEKNGMYHHEYTEETLEKMRKPKSSVINMCKPKSDEHRAHMRAAKKWYRNIVNSQHIIPLNVLSRLINQGMTTLKEWELINNQI